MAQNNTRPRGGKAHVSGYARSKEYIPKFTCFLIERKMINNYAVQKPVARKIFMEEFKVQHGITKYSFSAMCLYLRYFKLARYDKRSDSLCFKVEFLNYVKHDVNLDNQKKFNIIPILRPHQNSTVNVKSQTNEKAIPSTLPVLTTKPLNKPKECSVCNVTFVDDKSKIWHGNSELHKLRNKYLQNKKTVNKNVTNIIIEIAKDHGSKSEKFIVRENTLKVLQLNIINNTETSFCILNVQEINISPFINIDKNVVKFPYTLKESTKISININVLFKENIFLIYPIMVSFKNFKNKNEVDVVKDLLFHVHTSVIDDLHPTSPYIKAVKQINQDLIEVTDVGQHSEKKQNYFIPKLPMPQYRLPDDITILINNDFKEVNNTTAQQKLRLDNIMKMFTNYEKKGLSKENYFNLLQLLLYFEEHQMIIDIRNYECDNQKLLRTPVPALLELQVPGLSEHRPSVLRGDSVFIKENRQSTIKYEGIVDKINQNSILLGFSYRFLKTVHENNKKYFVSFTFNRIPLRAEHQAIDLIRKHNVIEYFFPEKVPVRSLKDNNIAWFNSNILDNEKQKQAVKYILSEASNPSPYLIFGPPGTGKTVTVVEAVLQIWKLKESAKILICTPSNSSADEIAKRLVKHVPKRQLLRYVAPSHQYDFIDREVKPYVNYTSDYFHPPLTSLLSYRIIILTLVNACRLVNAGIKPNHFNYVFIDESGQATESETLIPIAGILTENKALNGQIILVGDPEQLGPIIHSKRAIDLGFETSMLERLMKRSPIYQKNKDGQYNDAVLTKLVQNYRSHPAILELPNKLFYDGDLIPNAERHLTHVAVGWECLPNKNIPIIFHAVFGKDEREENSPSFFNLQEIQVVYNYLEKLIGQRLSGMQITQEQIGVITPYHKQVQKLKKACSKQKWSDLRIGTVEQFQGGEKLIIIVSTVRCRPEFSKYDKKFNLGFLQNRKRFNVAMTRAKALLIVIGDPRILQYDKYWYEFLNYCKDNRLCCGTAFELSSEMCFTDENIISPVCTPDAEETSNFSRGNV